MRRGVREWKGGGHRQIGPDVDEFARCQWAPAGVVVHGLSGDEDVRGTGKFRTSGMDPAASGVQWCRRVWGFARVPFQNMEFVGCRISEAPKLCCRRQNEVEAKDGQLAGDPGDGLDDSLLDVASRPANLSTDKREEALAIGLAKHQGHGSKFSEMLVEPGQALQDAVVGKETTILLERMRIDQSECARACVPHMGKERGALEVTCFSSEGVVFPSGQGLLGHPRCCVRPEGPDASAVRFASALHGKTVRSVQEPERGPDRAGASVQAEESTHSKAFLKLDLSLRLTLPRKPLRWDDFHMGEQENQKPVAPSDAASEGREQWQDSETGSPTTQQMRTVGQRRREAERKLDQHLEEARHKAEAADLDDQKTET